MLWKKKQETSVGIPETPKADAPGATIRRKKIKITFLTGLAAFVVTGSLGAAVYYHSEYQKLPEAKNPQAELESLLTRISAFYELPFGEAPTLATVTDKEKLSGQDFFVGAENGDKVLLYATARKAILYRPSTGKIVNVMPINVPEPAPAASEPVAPAPAVAGTETSVEPAPTEETVESEAPAEPARVALYNGTTKKGITTTFEKDELSDTASYEVVAKENAARNDYEKTVVVNLATIHSARAEAIASALGVEIFSEIPDGEPVPDADILVILGADRL